MDYQEAMRRLKEIENMLEMYDRMKSMAGPPHKVRITEAGHEDIASLETERAEIVMAHGH